MPSHRFLGLTVTFHRPTALKPLLPKMKDDAPPLPVAARDTRSVFSRISHFEVAGRKHSNRLLRWSDVTARYEALPEHLPEALMQRAGEVARDFLAHADPSRPVVLALAEAHSEAFFSVLALMTMAREALAAARTMGKRASSSSSFSMNDPTPPR